MQADLWTRIGESYLRKGDIQQSINSLEKARQGQPDNTVITTNLGMLYEMQNKTDVARKYYEMSIKTDPNNPLALNNLAYLISQTNGDLDQALTYADPRQAAPPGAPRSQRYARLDLSEEEPDRQCDRYFPHAGGAGAAEPDLPLPLCDGAPAEGRSRKREEGMPVRAR